MKLTHIVLAAMLAIGGLYAQPKGDTKKPTPAAPAKPAAAANQCAAMTKEGNRCKRKAQEGSQFCWQHAKAAGGKSEPKKKS